MDKIHRTRRTIRPLTLAHQKSVNVCILNPVLRDVFWAAVLSDRSDDCLRSVFIPLYVAIDSVHSRF